MAIKEKNQLSKNLIHFRKLHKMNQTQLADLLGISRERYAKYENNINPSIEILEKLASIYEIKLDTLIKAEQYTHYIVEPSYLHFSDVSPEQSTEASAEVVEILEKIDSLSPQLKRKVYEELINKIEIN